MARELGMDFRLKLSWDPEFSPVRDEEFVKRELGFDAASRAEYKQTRGADYMQHLCLKLWSKPQINWDGKVLGCSRNFWGDIRRERVRRWTRGRCQRRTNQLRAGDAPGPPAGA